VPRRTIRPRVWMKGRDHPLTLEEALALSPPPREPGDLLVIRGGPGSGKTTALALAAAHIGRYTLQVLDEPAQLDLTAARLTGPVLATHNVPGLGLSNSLELCPWTDDELIEYCLANHPAACASIMKRVLAMPDRHRLGGVPALWAPILDHMASHDGAGTIAGLIDLLVRQEAPGWDLKKAREAAWSLLDPHANFPKGLAEAARRLLRHRPVRLQLQAQHLVSALAGMRPQRVLVKVPPGEVVTEAAPQIAASRRAINALTNAAEGRRSKVHAAAATLLIGAGVAWRPRDGHVPLLDGARLAGAEWDRCKLPGLRATAASLQSASLAHADLSGAILNDTDLSDANLSECTLTGAQLTGARLAHADLTRAVCREARFHAADLTGACLEETDCSQSRFSRANLTGVRAVRANLFQAHFANAAFEDADLTAANLEHAELIEADLTSAILMGIRAEGVRLDRCNLAGVHIPAASFRHANITRADLTGSSMPAADLAQATLRDCGLADVDWEGATLRGADLTGSTFHMGSSRSGLVFSPIASEGTRTGFYTDDYDDRTHKHPEEIRKANLCGVDVRAAKVEGVDFYLVDLRRAKYDIAQAEWFRKCGAILKDHDQ
jgi:uncharacterized protein YjbI with pentapeptide repeats